MLPLPLLVRRAGVRVKTVVTPVDAGTMHFHPKPESATAAVQTLAAVHWPLPGGLNATLANVSENTTFRLDDPRSGQAWALRVNRRGYHSLNAIRSELAWAAALRADGVALTPVAVPGLDGELVQHIAWQGEPRHAVLFHWEAGREPTVADEPAFALMGETAARMHDHVRRWQPPPWFERHSWTFATSLGETPHWGRWRDGIGVTSEIAGVFAQAIGLIERRLARFGVGAERFGLIHGDMRQANLLIDGPRLKVLDFDDCGFSWLLYDAAATVSFFEHRPEVAGLIAARADGYRRARALAAAADEAELPTFILLRRLLLVAWLGSHGETQLARELGAVYTEQAVPMCEDYLRRMGG